MPFCAKWVVSLGLDSCYRNGEISHIKRSRMTDVRSSSFRNRAGSCFRQARSHFRFDKTGIVDFAKALADKDVELVSTGGTCKAIADAGIPVKDISEVTEFPEIMDGRVKTLHPRVHGGCWAHARLKPTAQR